MGVEGEIDVAGAGAVGVVEGVACAVGVSSSSGILGVLLAVTLRPAIEEPVEAVELQVLKLSSRSRFS